MSLSECQAGTRMSSPFSPLCRGGKDNPMEAGHCGIAFKKSGEGRKKKTLFNCHLCSRPRRAHRCYGEGGRWVGGGGNLGAVVAILRQFITVPDNLRNT